MAGAPPPRRPSETSLYTDAMALLSKKTRASMALHSAISISFQCFQALMAGPCDARGVHVHILGPLHVNGEKKKINCSAPRRRGQGFVEVLQCRLCQRVQGAAP